MLKIQYCRKKIVMTNCYSATFILKSCTKLLVQKLVCLLDNCFTWLQFFK
jgi:hypothetical protein